MNTTPLNNDDDAVIDVSIVILNWNTLELTTNAIQSLQQHVHGSKYEIILIDNGSTRDASATELPRRFPEVRFVANARNLGFCAACNLGVQMSRGRTLLLLNNDTIQTEDAVSKALHYLDSCEHDVAAVGILHRNNDPDRSFQPSTHDDPSVISTLRELLLPRALQTRRRQHLRIEERDVDWCCGSFLIFRRSAWETVGPLDERLFAYDEDIDWCRRARALGYRIRFWPGASMIHLGSASSAQMADKSFVQWRNRLYYFRKHRGRLASGSVYVALVFRSAIALVSTSLLSLFGRRDRAAIARSANRLKQFAWNRDQRWGF